jgi:hypothetical protein
MYTLIMRHRSVGSSWASLLTAHRLVANLISVALRDNNTGAYVSGIHTNPIKDTQKPKMLFTHIVHLQPKELVTMKLPEIGPMTGPTKAAPRSADKATPLSTDSHISVKPPLTVAKGAAPNRPHKNRHTRMVSML